MESIYIARLQKEWIGVRLILQSTTFEQSVHDQGLWALVSIFLKNKSCSCLFFFFFLISYMWVFCLHEKRSKPLGPELQMIVSHRADSGNQIQVFWKSSLCSWLLSQLSSTPAFNIPFCYEQLDKICSFSESRTLALTGRGQPRYCLKSCQ